MGLNKILLIAIVALIALVAVTQYTSNKKITSLTKEVTDTRETLLVNQAKSEKAAKELTIELNDATIKTINELGSKLNEIEHISNNNTTIVNRLHKEVSNSTANYDKLTDSARKRYFETTNELFTESTRILTEIGTAADRSTAAAISYHNLLKSQKEIVDAAVDKYNKDLETTK